MFIRNPEWHKLTGAIRFPHRMKEVQQIIDEQGVALFKTHELPSEMHDDYPVIYLLRDGREACVSYWHFLREIGAVDITLAEVIRGECMFGGWSDHVRAWEPKRRAKTLYLPYEAIHRTPQSTRWPLEHFLSIRLQCSDLRRWQDVHQSDPQFFRSGTNETWKTEMTGDDLALFNELHGDTMREYGYYPVKATAHADCTV